MAKRPRERGSIPGDFSWRLIEMTASPANMVMSLSAKRILERLEIELAKHGGKSFENGRLPCTFDHFEEFGIHRHAIAPAIREAVALGFVEITRPGSGGRVGNWRQPALYRLTYRHCGSHQEITDEWRRIKTVEEAKAIAEQARSWRGPKNKKPVAETTTGTSGGNRTERDRLPVAETTTTRAIEPVVETTTTSISREGYPPSPRPPTGRPPPRTAAARLHSPSGAEP